MIPQTGCQCNFIFLLLISKISATQPIIITTLKRELTCVYFCSTLPEMLLKTSLLCGTKYKYAFISQYEIVAAATRPSKKREYFTLFCAVSL